MSSGGRRACAAVVAVLMALLLLSASRPAQAVPPRFFGLVSTGNYLESAEDWDTIQRSGARQVRYSFFWQTLNEKGWGASFDRGVELASSHGITLLGTLGGRQTSAATKQFFLKSEWSEWLGYVRLVVKRYGYGGSFWASHPGLPYRPVRAWEVWNEPNLTENNPGEVVHPHAYAEFLIATSRAIRSAQASRTREDPKRPQVLIGGLNMEVGMQFREFLEKASEVSGFAEAYDGLCIHPYELSTAGEAAKLAGVVQKVTNARTVLTRLGGEGKSLWITELGWPVGGAGRPPVSEAEQANLLLGSYSWLEQMSEPMRIRYAAWYLYRDIDFPGDPWDFNAGLLNTEGAYRPAWRAYQSVTGASPWPLPPRAVTRGATGLKASGATVHGAVNPHGSAATYAFQYGRSRSYGAQAPDPPAGAGRGGRNVSVEAALRGLAPGRAYHYRLVAQNAEGVRYGRDRTFSTTGP
jgi:hypothetical protein